MKSFHGNQAIKDKYLARIAKHRELDELVQGATGGNGKGCAVWCTLDKYEHEAYEDELGIPEWLARLEDCIFEGLPKDIAMLWPERFLTAIKPGIDLEKIKNPFVIFVLESNLPNFDHLKFPDVKKSIDECIRLYRENITEESSRSAAGFAARSAAESAAGWAAESAAGFAARSAARSAGWAAESAAGFAARSAGSAGWAAESAAGAAARSAGSAGWAAAWAAAGWAAESAAGAAESAAGWSTESAAWAARSAGSAGWAAGFAARSAAYVKFADKLIELLEKCE